MIFSTIILTISKRWLEKNSYEILPGSGNEIRGCPLATPPPHTHNIVLIIWQVDKQKGKLKLCQACPRASAFYVNPCRILIHFVGFSFHQFEWNEHTKDDELEIFWTIKEFWMSIYTHKKIEPVFVKHYAPNICLPLNMAKFTQWVISSKKKIGLCRKVKQIIYSSSPFQTASSNLADKVEMHFAKVHNFRKNWQHLFKC